MQQNMGTTDRLVRALIVAPVLLALALVVGFTSVPGIIAVVLAAVMLGTAAVGFCPLYLPFHLHTDRAPKASA